MSDVVSVVHLPIHVDKVVCVRGWVLHRRDSGKIRFLTLRDGSGIVQTIWDAQHMLQEEWEKFSQLKQESAIEVVGLVCKEPRSPGGVEIRVHHMIVHHIPDREYPISPKEHGPDFLLTHRHLWIRSPKQVAIMQVRHTVSMAIREYLNNQGFIETPTPILTPTACEGTTTLFTVPYFDLGEVYLSQSGQLYGEALAMAAEKIYTFCPAFRAERSKTRKHLTEFWMVEPEMAWYDREMTAQLVEALVQYVVKCVLERCQRPLEILGRNTEKLRRAMQPFHRMTYRETLIWLRAHGRTLAFGDNLGAEDEALIGEHHDVPVFILGYPKQNRAFYMKVDERDPEVVMDMDLIAPEGFGEIVGGSQREERESVLIERIHHEGLPIEPLEWYIDLRRFGTVPHSGFGLGIERTVAWICGAAHIRECIPFPRMLYRVQP